MLRTAEHPGRTVAVRADQVRKGQTVVAVPHYTIRPRRGQWPTVTAADYRQDGEDDLPAVYLELSDHRGAVYVLHPDEKVTVVA